MYRLLVEKQRRQLPYYLCTGLALGLSHEKTIWEKQRSREWWADIVKGTFSDDQWMENFRMTKIVSEYDQEIPQSQTADNPVAPRGRATQPSRDTRKTN